MATVMSGGEAIYYEVAGDGPAVVLCHGLGGNHAVWWQQVPALAAHHTVVTWDQRGFGNSTRRTGVVGPVPAVDDLRAVLDAAGVRRATVLGQSMGGWVAAGFAIAWPDRVHGLVLTDTIGGLRTPAVDAAVATARPRAVDPDSGTDHPALGAAFVIARPHLAHLYRQISSFGDKPGDEEMVRLLWSTRWDLDALVATRLPVLLVTGEHDDLIAPEAMAALHGALPGSHLETIAGCGHSPYYEAPRAWNDAVLRFLAVVRPVV